jgi:hypothetical protein
MRDMSPASEPVNPFCTPSRVWSGELQSFAPFQVSDTVVSITSAASSVDLVLSFLPATGVAGGIPRVSALQTVISDVRIDLTLQATLYWLASALEVGQLAPNQGANAYLGNDDEFRLQIGQDLSVSHDGTGWQIPEYDSAKYTVNVGFGLKIQNWVYWAYSVCGSPGQQLVIAAGAYEFVRSNGDENIGDPVFMTGMDAWTMALGGDYLLAFDACGQGTLSPAGPQQASPRGTPRAR